MRVLVILTVAAALVAAACAGPEGGGQAQPSEDGTGVPAPASEEGDAITGTLGGDAQLEGGCVWVDDGSTRWQVLWPDGYRVGTDPITVSGPEGVAIAEGDTVTVRGAEEPDAMTTCQVGPVWAATSVEVEG